jgi:hypothetical protein
MAQQVIQTKFQVDAAGNAATFLDAVNKKVQEYVKETKRAQAQSKGWAKSIGDQGKALGIEGRDSLLTLARGGGALAITNVIGNALQKLPETIDQFTRNIANGQTKTEAFATALAESVPLIGDLAKGFRAVLDVVGGTTGRSEAWMKEQAAEREAAERRRVQVEKIKGDTAAERNALAQALLPTDPALRVIAQARLAASPIREKLGALGTAAGRAGMTDAQVRERQALLQGQLDVIARDANAEMERLWGERLDKEIKAEKDKAKALDELRFQLLQESLKAAGDEGRAALNEIERDYAQSIEGLSDTDPKRRIFWDLAAVRRGALWEKLRKEKEEAENSAWMERGQRAAQLRGQGLQAMRPAMEAIFGWLNRPGLEAQFSGGLAPVVERGGLTGLAAQSRERNTLVNQAKEQTKFLGNIKDGINKIGSSIADLGKKIALFDLN